MAPKVPSIFYRTALLPVGMQQVGWGGGKWVYLFSDVCVNCQEREKQILKLFNKKNK